MFRDVQIEFCIQTHLKKILSAAARAFKLKMTSSFQQWYGYRYFRKVEARSHIVDENFCNHYCNKYISNGSKAKMLYTTSKHSKCVLRLSKCVFWRASILKITMRVHQSRALLSKHFDSKRR